MVSVYFCYFTIFSPRKRVWAFIWTNLNPHQRIFVPTLVEISPLVLKKTFKFSQCIFVISLSYPLWKRWDSSFEKTWIPFTQGCYVPSLVQNWPIGSGEDFKISSMYFRYLVIISLRRRVCRVIWQTLILLTKECFVSTLVKIGLLLLEIFRFNQCIFAISLLSPLGTKMWPFPPLE